MHALGSKGAYKATELNRTELTLQFSSVHLCRCVDASTL